MRAVQCAWSWPAPAVAAVSRTRVACPGCASRRYFSLFNGVADNPKLVVRDSMEFDGMMMFQSVRHGGVGTCAALGLARVRDVEPSP